MSEPQTPYEAYGIQCGPGWASLYDPLIELCNKAGVEITQIKEKFGGLRFYTRQTPSPELKAAIDLAEGLSVFMCEDCGQAGKRRSDNGWIHTLCDAHAVEHQKVKESS